MRQIMIYNIVTESMRWPVCLIIRPIEDNNHDEAQLGYLTKFGEDEQLESQF